MTKKGSPVSAHSKGGQVGHGTAGGTSGSATRTGTVRAALATARCPVALLVDTAYLMNIHRSVVGELTTAPDLAVSYFDGDSATALHSLAEPSPERVVLILSDALGQGWTAGAGQAVLREWAQRRPVALLQVLHSSLWRRTAMPARPLQLRRPATGETGRMANAQLAPEWSGAPSTPGRRELWDRRWAGAVPVPVIEADGGDLSGWLDLATGDAESWRGEAWPTTASSRPESAPGPPTANEESADRLIDRFLSTSSAGARGLAVRLAQAPVNLPVAEALQRTVPRSGPDTATAAASEITETFASPLLRRRTGAALDDPAAATLEFRAGVRERLLERLGDVPTMHMVFRVLGSKFRDTAGVYRWVAEAETARPDHEEVATQRELAAAVAPALRSLPGAYGRLGALLRSSLRLLDIAGEPLLHTPFALRQESVSADQQSTQEQAAPSARTSGATRRRHTPGRGTFFGEFPRRNPYFTGREAELERIHDSLSSRDTAVYVLTGGGGYGKTQLAIEYAYRFGGYRLVWWIPAEEKAEAYRALNDLAAHLGIDSAEADADSLSRALKLQLSTDPEVGRWLLIVDGADDLDWVERQILPPGGDGAVIITSRDQSWRQSGREEGEEIELPTEADAVALLHKACPGKLDVQTASHIAHRLDRLPIALVQVGAYLRDSLMDTAEFLELFDRNLDKIVAVAQPEGDYHRPLAALWSVQLDDLRSAQSEVKRMALQMIQLCSFLAPSAISMQMLVRARNLQAPTTLKEALRDPTTLDRVMQFIKRHSLAEFDYQTNSLRFHAVFQIAVQSSLGEEDRVRYRDMARLLLAQSDPLSPADPRNFPEFQRLTPHVQVSEAWNSPDRQVRQLVLNTIEFLTTYGNRTMAVQLADRTIDAWIVDDEDQLHQARLRRAVALRLSGRADEALPDAEAAYDFFATRYGTQDAATLQARRSVGITYRMLGRFTEAEQIYREVWQAREEILTEGDPQILESAHDYATILQLLYRFAEALPIDEENLQRRRFSLGEAHLDTINSSISLAVSQIALGSWEDARERLQRCLDILAAHGLQATPNYRASQRHLSVALRRLGRAAEAVAESAQLWEAEHLGGEEWTDRGQRAAAVHMVNLAYAGRIDQAVNLAERVMPHIQESFSSHQPFRAVALAAYGQVLRAAQRFARAEEVDGEAVQIFEAVAGEDTAASQSARVNLASDVFHLGRVQEARDRDTDCVQRLGRKVAADHPNLLHARRNLLVDRRLLGEDVEREWAELSAEYGAVLGAGHPATLSMADRVRADCDIISIDS
jgi:tetratricopeptide (TPR) repeat protein